MQAFIEARIFTLLYAKNNEDRFTVHTHGSLYGKTRSPLTRQR